MTVDSGPCGVGARHLYMSLVFRAYGGVCVPDAESHGKMSRVRCVGPKVPVLLERNTHVKYSGGCCKHSASVYE